MVLQRSCHSKLICLSFSLKCKGKILKSVLTFLLNTIQWMKNWLFQALKNSKALGKYHSSPSSWIWLCELEWLKRVIRSWIGHRFSCEHAKVSQVTFMYIVLYTMQVVSKRFYGYKLENNDANRVLFCCKEAIVNSRHSVEISVDSVWFNCVKFLNCGMSSIHL